MKKLIFGVFALGVLGSVSAAESKGNGSASSRPEGFIFDDGRLTIKPYVSLAYTWDSNIDQAHKADDDSIFSLNPGANFVWNGDRWTLTGGAWYRYNAYTRYNGRMGENSYGENLGYRWSNIGEDGKGWNVLISERYAFLSQSDNINDNDGRGIWRDRQKLDVSGALERRFTERFHASVMGQFSWLDYDNDTGKYAPLYGWEQHSLQIEAGYVLSPLTDLLIAGGYNDYTQDRSHGYRNYSNDSHSWTAQIGLGSHATEKITYRALVGGSTYSYGGHDDVDSGWTYQLSANWRVGRNVQISALGNSYYQPSERSLGQATKVYALSGGISYLTAGDRLTLTANVAYRLEQIVYSDRYLAANNDYDEYMLSFRLGADYVINRWVSIYANLAWEENWCEGYSRYDYDRFRGTLGLRFHY